MSSIRLHIKPLRDILIDTFDKPWKIVKKSYAAKQKATQLTELAASFDFEEINEKTNDILDKEGKVNATKLHQHIEDKVTTATKKLVAKVNSLQQQLSRDNKTSNQQSTSSNQVKKIGGPKYFQQKQQQTIGRPKKEINFFGK